MNKRHKELQYKFDTCQITADEWDEMSAPKDAGRAVALALGAMLVITGALSWLVDVIATW